MLVVSTTKHDLELLPLSAVVFMLGVGLGHSHNPHGGPGLVSPALPVKPRRVFGSLHAMATKLRPQEKS